MPPKNIDYYSVLGVDKRASLVDIRRQYRKLALKWHPDKNLLIKDEADRKFQEISEAYEILSNKQLREIYDRHGSAGPGESFTPDRYFDFTETGYQFRSPEEIFREFFGGRDPFAEFLSGSRGRGYEKGSMFEDSFSPFAKPSSSFKAPFFADPVASAIHAKYISTMFTGNSNGNFHSASSTTKYLNGKKIVTKRIVENNTETVSTEEDGRLTSKTVHPAVKPSTYLIEY